MKNNGYVLLNANIIQDDRLSFEGKGIYAGLQADCINIKDIPPNIIAELKEVGYFDEVKE